MGINKITKRDFLTSSLCPVDERIPVFDWDTSPLKPSMHRDHSEVRRDRYSVFVY